MANEAPTYQIKPDSTCGSCRHPDEHCRTLMTNIKPRRVFQNVESRRFYVFVHDQGECGTMCEVEQC